MLYALPQICLFLMSFYGGIGFKDYVANEVNTLARKSHRTDGNDSCFKYTTFWEINPTFPEKKSRIKGKTTGLVQPEGLQHTQAGLKEKPGLVFTPTNSLQPVRHRLTKTFRTKAFLMLTISEL